MMVMCIQGSRISSISPGDGRSAGLSIDEGLAAVHDDFVFDARGGGEQIEVVLALQPLLDDLHVEQTEEAAAEAEPERQRRLRLVGERGVVELQPFERVAEERVVLAVDRVETGEDHRFGRAVARQRLRGRVGRRG